jgi:predicted transcriptional regulator YheO
LGKESSDAYFAARFSHPLDEERYRKEAEATVSAYIPLVEPLAQAMPPNTEVVLHDFSKLPNTIVAISGSISGRQVGGPATDVSLKTIASPEPERYRIGYHTVTPNGRVTRSSSIYIFGSMVPPLGSLCLNTDITSLVQARDLIDQMVSLTPADYVGQLLSEAKPAERFFQTVEEAAQLILNEAIDSLGIEVRLASRAQKTEIVRELRARGFFLLKNSIEATAEALRVSRYTIYNYLNDLEPN